MKSTTRLLLAVVLMLVGMTISHASFAADAANMLSTGKAVADQTGLTQKATKKAGQLVNLNTATASQLTQVPGIGNTTADAIIAKRTQLGGKFDSVDQLLGVKGIKAKKLEAIKPFLTL